VAVFDTELKVKLPRKYDRLHSMSPLEVSAVTNPMLVLCGPSWIIVSPVA
jgi:hypothetical protein